MKRINRFKWIGLALLSCGLLVGCEEAENGKISDGYVESAFSKLNEENSTKLPDTVKNGTVSENIYLEVERYASEFVSYEENMLGFQDRLNKDSSLWGDSSFIDKYIESINAYDVFIKGFHLSPSTKADMEISNNLSDTLLYTSYMVSALRQYANTNEKHYVSSIEEDMNKRNTSYEALANAIKKHGLDIKE